MDESLTQQRRVRDEGLRVVNLCWMGKKAAMFDGTIRVSTG